MLDGPTPVEKVWSILRTKAFQETTRPTAIALSNDLIFVGHSNGDLYAYTKEKEK